jgi:hypothetical protein
MSVGILVLMGFFFIVSLVLSGYAKGDPTLIGAVVGYVSAKAEQVVGYYFGSSSGSARKTEMLLADRNIDVNQQKNNLTQ